MAARRQLRNARRLFLALLAFTVWQAAAEPVSYRVEIDAPPAIAAALGSSLDIVTWSGRDDVNEEQLRQLANTAPEQIRRILATEGYFSPEVNVELVQDEADWVVKVSTEPGEPTVVVSVDVRVTGDITRDPAYQQRRADALAAFTLTEGKTFRQSQWQASKDAAMHRLHRSLYAAATVSHSRAHIDPQTRQAKLTVEIDSGPPFYFGELRVIGLDRYPPRFVSNISPIKPGDPYDEKQLQKFQKRLLASGRFASAVVLAGNDPASAAATPIVVTVSEAQARKVELGIGYSTDRGARAFAAYNDRNAFDRAWQLGARATIDQISEEVASGIIFPRNQKGWHYGIEAKYEQEDLQGEVSTQWSVTGLHSYLVEERESRQYLQLVAENRVLPDGSTDNTQAVYLAQLWKWNQLDELLAPRDGHFASLEVGGASEQLLSDADFARLLGKASYYLPVKSFGTVAARIEAGVVFADSRNNIPSEYLFRTGGDTTVRGYEYESLGVAQGGAIVGGRYLLVGSIEYIQWLGEDWGAAIFYDAGNAVDDKDDYRAAAGYGIGARWYSPVGALSFDLAYGEEVDEYRVHFTAGFVFR